MAEEKGVAEKEQSTGEGTAMEQRLTALEGLLREQNELSKKAAKRGKLTAILLLCLVVVMAAGMFWLNQTLQSRTENLPVLINSTNQVMQQMETVLQEVGEVDYESLNGTIREMEEGLGNVDFQALNDSIVDLQKVAEGLARFMSFFGGTN